MKFTDEHKKLMRSERSRRNVKRGYKSQDVAEKYLRKIGFLFVEPIETGWVIIRKYDSRTKKNKIVHAFPKKKVSGDFTCVERGTGRAIHIEVKSMPDKLLWSNFEPHQIEALNEKSKENVLCFVAWVRSPVEVKLLQWPIFGFKKGKSVKWEDVR